MPVALLHPGVRPLAGDDVPVQGAHPGCVLGMHQVGHPDPAQLVDRVAQHRGERRVRVHDAAPHVGDADADRGAGEDRAEAGLAGPQRARHLPADVHLGLPHHLLLVQDPGPHPRQVAVDQRGLHGAGRARAGRPAPAAAASRGRCRPTAATVAGSASGSIRSASTSPAPTRRAVSRSVAARGHRVEQPPGGPHQQLAQLVPGHRDVGRAGQLVGPGRDETRRGRDERSGFQPLIGRHASPRMEHSGGSRIRRSGEGPPSGGR